MSDYVLECPICLGEFKHPVMPPCQHVFCYPCISRYIQKSEAKCPICRTAFSKEDLRRSLQIEQLLSAKNNEPVPPCESDGYPKSFDFSSKPRSQQQVDRSKWVTTLAAGAAGVLIGVIGAAIGYSAASKRRR